MTIYSISPSSLGWDWKECPYCFRAKVVEGWKPERKPSPRILNKFDETNRVAYANQDLNQLGLPVPPCQVITKTITLKSAPIAFPGTDSQIVLSGRTDGILKFPHNQDLHGILDFKSVPAATQEDQQKIVDTYFPQIAAYGWMMEHPDITGKKPSPFFPNVEYRGIIPFCPEEILLMPGYDQARSQRRWIPIPRDDQRFLNLLQDIVRVLDGTIKADPDNCESCFIRIFREKNQPENSGFSAGSSV